MPRDLNKDADLLKEIRDNFTYATDAWREIREQARLDMACVSGDTWDPAERARREDPKQSRPCLSLDKCNQFVNQLINDVREAKRSIMVIPRGAGANDEEAELRGNIIRDIEYDSNAQSAYITGFENAVQRSYGWLRVTTCFVEPGKKEQKIVIRRIPNPDTVWPDPDFREADSSDKAFCFVVDYMSKRKFQREFPKAQIQGFTNDHMMLAPKWIQPNNIQVAEYWKLEKFDDKPPVVTQYTTNGVEILDEKEWAGKYIPLVLFVGKELWIDDDGGAKRVWESLVRHARDPQQLLNYCASTKAEVLRMVPKTPFVAAKDQIINPEEWQKVNDTPLAYLLHDPYAGGIAGTTAPLPPPMRPSYDPPIQAIQIAEESAERSIQSAMGIQPLPIAAQRQNEKSGIAIQRIQDETQKGSFHFVDNYENALMFTGRIINNLMPVVYDTARDVGISKKDGTHHVIKLNKASQDENGQPVQHMLTDGEYDVTISTGPSYQSEREQADQFMQQMLPTLESLPLDPAIKAQLLALMLKLKDFGPIGEEMVELIAPKDKNMPPQAKAMILKTQQELQLAQATITQLMQEKVAKHAELQNALDKAKLDNDTKVLIAEIETKAQSADERVQMFKEVWIEAHGAAHEAALSAQEHAQALVQGQQAAQQQQAAQAAEQQSSGAQEPEPEPAIAQ